MSNEPSSLITSRSEFHAALRLAFVEAAAQGSRELWLCDNDFGDWPLGERAVIEQLSLWAASSRKMTLVALTFDEVSRRHARWVQWRQQWSHMSPAAPTRSLKLASFRLCFLLWEHFPYDCPIRYITVAACLV
jgi:hypothetical protein